MALKGLSFTKKQSTARDYIYKLYLASQIKAKYNKSTDVQESIKGHRLHADISRILLLSVQGFRYFLLVADDATRIL